MNAAAHWRLMRILIAIAGFTSCIDAIWIGFGNFEIDYGTYSILILPLLVLVGGAVYYGCKRKELSVAATFAAATFLIVFPAACSLLSYLSLTIAGPRIDALLAGIDAQMGFSWPALMGFAARHVGLTAVLRLIYLSVMPQTAFLILLLGWKERVADLYGFCLALSIGAIITVCAWTAFPSFGAFSVFDLPPQVASRLGLALNGDYGHQLIAMLKSGPGRISVREMRGLVGFPSYHTVQALTLAWYARNVSYARWPAIVLNAIVLVAVPVHGGHHLVDMIGGAAVTFAAIAIATWTVNAAASPARADAFAASPLPDATQSAPA
jgi:hypothetical protein